MKESLPHNDAFAFSDWKLRMNSMIEDCAIRAVSGEQSRINGLKPSESVKVFAAVKLALCEG